MSFPQLVRAAIEAGAINLFREVRTDYLVEGEEELYQFVRRHLDRYSQLPSIETIREAGYALVRGRETAQYHLDQIRRRFAYNQLNLRQPAYIQAMRDFKPDEAVPILREMLLSVGNTITPHQYSTLTAEVRRVDEDFEFAKGHPGLRGVTLAWPSLNEMTLGAQGGDLIVIAGRPSIGKSYLLMECAHDAWVCGHSSIFISMEMTLLQIARRWVGRCSGINPRLIHQGHLSAWGESHFKQTIRDIEASSAPVHFLAGDMEKRVDGIEEMAQEFCPDIIYIDAAYLLEPTLRHKSGVAKWEQMSQVIKELKKLAQRINRAIVITVQFNRNVTSNHTKDLDMRDIGGSDSIPQDASVVIGARKGPAPYQHVKRILQTMKNREGEVGDFCINFRFAPMDFSQCPMVSASSDGETVSSEWMV